jgi:hypothetical protein
MLRFGGKQFDSKPRAATLHGLQNGNGAGGVTEKPWGDKCGKTIHAAGFPDGC